MIRCPFTRDAVRNMIPIFRSDEHIARRVSNSAYRVSTADVRATVPRKPPIMATHRHKLLRPRHLDPNHARFLITSTSQSANSP